MRLTLLIFFLGFWIRTNAQVTADFDLPVEVCQKEQFQLENTSINSVRSEWDYCPNDLLSQPSKTNSLISPISNAKGLKIIKNNNVYFGFIIANSRLYRLEFGESLLNTPLVIDLGDLDGAITNGEDIDIVKENNYWIGFVGFGSSGNGGNIIRLEWSNLLLPPEATNIGNFGQNGRIRGLDIVQSDNLNVLVLIYYNNRLSRVDFGNSFLNSFSPSDIYINSSLPTVSLPVDVNIKNVSNEWFAIISSVVTKTVSIFSLGNDLFSEPILTQSQTFDSYAFLSKSSLAKDGDSFYLLLSTLRGPLHLLNLGNLVTSSITEVPIANMPTGYAVDIIKNESQYFAFSSVSSLDRLLFSNNCVTSINFSEQTSPSISYSSPGTFPINLTAYDNAGNASSITKSITVTTNTAPEINITTSSLENCINASVNFSASSPQTITSWSWGFGNGDTATGQNTDYTFNTPGTYEVTVLAESTNGCTNLQTQTIDIFAPPTATFGQTTQGSICSQKPIQFTNTSVLPTAATFSWDFGDGNSSTEENPTHVYTSQGTYEVELIIEMAGCIASTTQMLMVEPGPIVDFEPSKNCFGQIVNFTNNSSGAFITAYEWDFGDGTSSTLENPAHSYATAGTKSVTLTAFTSNGCDFSFIKDIEIAPLAAVDFSTAPACSGQSIQFTEEVILEGIGVTDYLWTFNPGNPTATSNLQNPNFTFAEAGTYAVTLQVTTADGCVSQNTKTVEVAESPQPEISFNAACLGESITFSGNASANIINEFWEVTNAANEQIVSSTNPSLAFSFTSPGLYKIRYRQETADFCSRTKEETLTIVPPPAAIFNVSNLCANETISIQNNSELNQNELAYYEWFLDGESISTSPEPELIIDKIGTYELALILETTNGCIAVSTKTINISEQAVADFTFDRNIVAVPFKIELEADISNDEMARWLLNDELISDSAILNLEVNTAGLYFLSLEVSNAGGCTQVINKQINAQLPVLNISAGNLRAVDNNNFTEFLLTITNNGSLVPDSYNVTISFDNFTITERVDVEILPTETKNQRLSLQLSESQLNGINSVCIEVEAIKDNFEDNTPSNNSACVSLTADFKVLTIFPNPAKSDVSIPIILPEKGTVAFLVEQSDGKSALKFNADLEAGYNEVRLPKGNLGAGIYFIRIRYQQTELVRKVVFY